MRFWANYFIFMQTNPFHWCFLLACCSQLSTLLWPFYFTVTEPPYSNSKNSLNASLYFLWPDFNRACGEQEEETDEMTDKLLIDSIDDGQNEEEEFELRTE